MVSERQHAGFTLIELMVTIAVLAILLTLAMPSFQQTIRTNRVATASNELLASLALARSEAIRSNRNGSVCASADGNACGLDWNGGWLVWSDTNANGDVDNDEPVVRYSQGKAGLNVVGPQTAFSFSPRGRLLGAPANVVMSTQPCPSGQEFVRTTSVGQTGQARITRSDCQ